MKKYILVIILSLYTFSIHAQFTAGEKQSLDSLLKTGRLSPDQVIQLQRKLNSKDNFKNFSESIDEISYPTTAPYQNITLDQNWIRIFSVLNSSSDMFYVTLKNSLTKYVNDVVNDYNF